MDPASLTEDVFQLSSDHGPVGVQFAYDDQAGTLTLTPDAALSAATFYTAVITTGVRDQAQNPLSTPYTWQFWTRGPLYDLIVTKSGDGSGKVAGTAYGIDCGDTCHAGVDAGTIVTLEAIAEDGSEFTGWSGDFCNDETGSCTFTMTSNTTLSANFTLLTYTISTSVIPADGSYGLISPPNATFNYGDAQTFDILAKPYHRLSELTVDGNPIAPVSSYHFENIADDHVIEAKFESNRSKIPNPDSAFISTLHLNAQGHVVYTGGVSRSNIYYFDGSQTTIISEVYDLPGVHQYPQINAKGHIVWQCINDSSYDIYYFDGSNITNITEKYNIPGEHLYPAINDNGPFVWHTRNGPYSDADADYDIYYFDGSNVTNINDTYAVPVIHHMARPQINANGHVAWSGKVGEDEDWAIYYFNGLSVDRISNTSGHHSNLHMNANGHVVWLVRRGGIFPETESFSTSAIVYFDGSNSFEISGIADLTSYPQINADGHVVWSIDMSETDNGIYYYDGSAISNITSELEGKHWNPKINANGHVVWFTLDSIWNVYYWDESTATNISNNSAEFTIAASMMERAFMVYINDRGHVVWVGDCHTPDDPDQDGQLVAYYSFF